MHGVLLDVAEFPPKGGMISFSPFLSLTLVPAAAMPIYPWPPLDRGIPVKSAVSQGGLGRPRRGWAQISTDIPPLFPFLPQLDPV